MTFPDPENLKNAISKFTSARVLVIGDIIVDHFIWGSVSRISPEAPVPVVNVTDENMLLGGAANVLHNIFSLGGKADLCGVIGADFMGDKMLELLAELNSPTAGIIKTADRPTTKKTRVVAQSQQVVRFDREKSGSLPAAAIAKLNEFITAKAADYDAVVISDYSKGVINSQVMDHLRANLQASGNNIPMIVDPKPKDVERFKGATIMTPNHHEAEMLSGISIDDDESLVKAAHLIQQRLASKALLITRGEAGMALFEDDKPMYSIPTVAKEVYDVTGAGDTVIATLALGLAVGLAYAEAATLANYAAGIVVGKVGTATAAAQELAGAI